MFVFQRQEGNKVVNEISVNQGTVPKSTYKGKEKGFVTTSLVKHYHGLNGSKRCIIALCYIPARIHLYFLGLYNAQSKYKPLFMVLCT